MTGTDLARRYWLVVGTPLSQIGMTVLAVETAWPFHIFCWRVCPEEPLDRRVNAL
jgi:hypothetical protein